jgi:hypothetical protein
MRASATPRVNSVRVRRLVEVEMGQTDVLREEIRAFLGVTHQVDCTSPVVLGEMRHDGFDRKAVSYATPDGDTIEAFLFEPLTTRLGAGVVVVHQHNSEWEMGRLPLLRCHLLERKDEAAR